MIAAAQIGTQPLHHRRDHLVADREPVGLVDTRKIVDRDDEHGERGAQPVGVVQRVGEEADELPASHLAGEAVGPGGAFSGVLLVDDAHDAGGGHSRQLFGYAHGPSNRIPRVSGGEPSRAY
jgi:hypothetical protein